MIAKFNTINMKLIKSISENKMYFLKNNNDNKKKSKKKEN